MRKIFLLSLFVCVSCFGVARTASVTGNWSNTATWGGSSVPGNGDTITINSGITVTVDVNTTVGASPVDCTGTIDVQNNSGILVIPTGIQFTLRGCMKMAGSARLTGAADSILECDASVAGSPATTHYTMQIGTSNSNTETNLVTLTGASYAHPVTVRSNAGGGNCSFSDGGFVRGGMMNVNFFSFLRLGTSAIDALIFSPFNAADVFTLKNGACDTCGQIRQRLAGANTAHVTIDGVTMVNTASANSIVLFGASGYTAGFHQLINCVFDKVINVSTPFHWTFTNDLMLVTYVMSTGAWDSFDNNIIYGGVNATLQNTISNTYFITTAASNPHYVVFSGNNPGTLDGVIYEDLGATADGDTLSITTGSGLATVQNSVKLPNSVGTSSGTALSLAGSASTQTIYLKNTFFLGGAVESSGLRYGETFAGVAGMITGMKSNAFWDTSARGWKFLCNVVNCVGSTADVVSSANADFNGGSSTQFLAGNAGKGYNAVFSSGSPGVHDLDADPGFADRTRNFAKWDLSLGGPGTAANALAQLEARNSASWNPNYNIHDLINWVKQGFAPQILSFATSGHDGGRIGAVPVIAIMGGVTAQ